ncbi:DUF4058 family protein [Anatilimnocola sp. NA78]|uniref:DUF4058 family protein n=1 Tax=Anatilimnocola sp. NA78 TaxID=3415683 RepID=UPI003CE5B118
MKSPFPGMDPYLELHWLDVHHRLIGYISDQLQDQLPKELLARIGERVVMEFDDHEEPIPPGKHPDVLVKEEGDGGVAVAVLPAVQTEVAVPDGMIYEEFSLPETETYVEIVDAKTRNKVISVIELISPTNKVKGKGLDSYLDKRAMYYHASVHLIEIDLTRGGDRRLIMPWIKELPPPHPAFIAGVHRFGPPKSKPRIEYYELPMERALKPIAIPLRPTDKDVTLHLQPLLEQAYLKGRYSNLDYSRQIEPPLSFAELELLQQYLAKRA